MSNDIKQQLTLQVEENLNKEQQDGYFRPDIDMGMFANSLIGIMERLTLTKLFTGLRGPETLAHEIVHLLLYGLLNNNEENKL